ncbi:MAG: aminodeoxychorismate/anthranilate synthase component II [Patescibacteria group bacterium]|mgnify:CR=1 FL=1
MRILILDNFDSFTFNLYQLVGELLLPTGGNVGVKRNNEITTDEIHKAQYDRIIISPGPGDPSDRQYFGVCADVLQSVSQTVPTLGVCLGMQGMGYYFGGRVIHAKEPMHGKTSQIEHDGKGIFENLPQGLEVMRYHSLIVDEASLPSCLTVTARVTQDNGRGEIMGLRHKMFPIEGMQFHPESFATEGGKSMIHNFLFTSYERVS